MTPLINIRLQYLKDESYFNNIGETGRTAHYKIWPKNMKPNVMLIASDTGLTVDQVVNRDYSEINIYKQKAKTYFGIPSFVGRECTIIKLNPSIGFEKNKNILENTIKSLYGNNNYEFPVHNMTVEEYQNLYTHPENGYIILGDEDYFLVGPDGIYAGNRGTVRKLELHEREVTGILLPFFKIEPNTILAHGEGYLYPPTKIEEILLFLTKKAESTEMIVEILSERPQNIDMLIDKLLEKEDIKKKILNKLEL